MAGRDEQVDKEQGAAPEGASRQALPPAPRLSLEDRLTLARYRKQGAEVLGKIWNAPNTAIGLAYGLTGYGVGKLMGRNPHIGLGGNAVQFTNNPFGGVSAVTLGNTTVWNGNPYDASDSHSGLQGPKWFNDDGSARLEDGHTPPQHEEQHTRQGEMLGPFYLPSNLLGGVNALLHGQDWHGSANWNEVGPQMNPPRPWAGK
jgi:hypothetical protein